MDFDSVAHPGHGNADEISAGASLKENRFTFFRQSGWMLMATVASSVFMAFVQGAAQRMPKEPVDEYGSFAALMEVLGQMSLPIVGVLTVFMHQTVAATTDDLRR